MIYMGLCLFVIDLISIQLGGFALQWTGQSFRCCNLVFGMIVGVFVNCKRLLFGVRPVVRLELRYRYIRYVDLISG